MTVKDRTKLPTTVSLRMTTNLLLLKGIACVTWQITTADIVGPQADEFLLKVQKAATGPPWHMESPRVVLPKLFCLLW